MKKLFTYIVICICTFGTLQAQLSDDFSDGNMSEDPAWFGDIIKFEIDASQKLHLNAPAEASQAYLSTASKAIGESEWSWYTEINVNPSSTNFCKVYLTSDQAVLDGPLNGYFVKIGGTQDEVSLYRQQGLSETMIINGNDGRVNVALVKIFIKVKRDMIGNWLLEVKPASETSYIEEGVAFDDTFTSSEYFGVYCKYTATRSSAFYFDDILVTGVPIPDTTAPKLLSHLPSNAHEIKLHFSEPLLASSALQKSNYLLNGQQAESINYAHDTVKLLFSSSFPNAVTQQLTVSGIADESLNLMTDTLVDVFYFEKVEAEWGSLVINEIFPDPTPSVLNLPDESDAEFIEIYNPSPHPYEMKNWMINGKSLPAFILLPGNYLILCKPAYQEIFNTYGNTLSMSSWPTLANSGGSVFLSDPEGNIIDSIVYTAAEIAEGYSLERMQIVPPCGGQKNLAISTDPNGATPGALNTAFSDEQDLLSPDLLKITTLTEDSLRLTFSEKTYLSQPYTAQVVINNTIHPKQVSYVGVDSTELLVILDHPLASHADHHLSIQEAYDCNGNVNPHINYSFYLDLQAPFVEQLIVLDTSVILLRFSEKLFKASAEKESNYTLYPFGKAPKSALLGMDGLSVSLTFPFSLVTHDSLDLSIQNLEDLYKNSIPAGQSLTSTFIYHSQIDSVSIVNNHQLDIHFNIAPKASSALQVHHYAIDRSVGNPASVVIDEHQPKVLHLLLQNPLSPNRQHALTVSNLTDDNNHLLSTPKYHFFYDTKGPAIIEVKVVDARQFLIFFDEPIHLKSGQKPSLWIDKDSVAIASYVVHEKHLSLNLIQGLSQEKNYKIGIEGVFDQESNPSNPAQNFAFLLDQVAPQLDTAFFYSPYELMLVFHEPLLAEELSADNYLRLVHPAHLPSGVKFYQLSPEKVLFSFGEAWSANDITFQIKNFSDYQQNRITSAIDYQIVQPQPGIGHVVPMANNHLRVYFTSDIQSFDLGAEHFVLNKNIPIDSFTRSSPHQLELWFDHTFFESTNYQLTFSYGNHKQSINFLYQDFVESIAHDGKSTVKIYFSVPLEASTAERVENYYLESHGHPLGVVYIAKEQMVNLIFGSEIDRSSLQKITIRDVVNIDHFPLPYATHYFGMGRMPNAHQLLISEIMAKPTPTVGLPDTEYIELYNTSEYPLQLLGMKLADAQKTVNLPEQWLSPGEYLILCSTSAVSKLSAYGRCMGISGFPSLNDNTDTLRLLNASGHEIHTVSYSDAWYNDASKKKGGWSLEMIDTAWPCQGIHNWTASMHPRGGTPGKVNSVQQSNPDLQAPQLLQAMVEDSLHILLRFSEKLDEKNIKDAKITLNDFPIDHIYVQEDTQLKVRLASPLQAGVVYKLAVSHVADCSGNRQIEQSIMNISLPEKHQKNDVLVSEILFHTRPGGVDFVELYNHSEKSLSLKNWKLATLRNGILTNPSLISTEALTLAPQEYVAITISRETLLADYPHATKGHIFESKAFPSLLADGGTLLLLDAANQIMQQIDFSPDWHHPLLQEKRGVSLERIAWNVDENDRQYWQSAASSAGYATPGYQNSQWHQLPDFARTLQIDPPIFYPDQSGYLDYTRIHFQFEGAGNIGNLKVFDARGRMVRQLAQNQSLSEEGFFTWDGTDDFKKRVHIGYYIVWMEVFRPDGTVNILKSKVAVASKF